MRSGILDRRESFRIGQLKAGRQTICGCEASRRLNLSLTEGNAKAYRDPYPLR